MTRQAIHVPGINDRDFVSYTAEVVYFLRLLRLLYRSRRAAIIITAENLFVPRESDAWWFHFRLAGVTALGTLESASRGHTLLNAML